MQDFVLELRRQEPRHQHGHAHARQLLGLGLKARQGMGGILVRTILGYFRDGIMYRMYILSYAQALNSYPAEGAGASLPCRAGDAACILEAIEQAFSLPDPRAPAGNSPVRTVRGIPTGAAEVRCQPRASRTPSTAAPWGT